MTGQAIVIRELLAFALGVLVMTAIISIFSATVSPELEEYSLNEQAYSLLYRVHSLFEKSASMARTTLNTSLFVLSDMPGRIVDLDYTLFIDNNQLCLRTKGSVTTVCIPLTVNAMVNGNYSSGSDLLISSFFSDDTVTLLFNNY